MKKGKGVFFILQPSSLRHNMATSVTPPPPVDTPHRVREEMTHFRRWVRRNTSRDAIVSSLKTLAWVVPLTLLIWVYAEREQETPQRDVPILISVKSNDPNRVVKLTKDIVVQADLRGPRSQLDTVRAELAKSNESQAIRIDIPNSLPTGLADIPVQQIENAPLFVDNGIKVENIHPGTVQVLIDKLDTRELPVEVRPADSAALSSHPVFTPATVKLRAPLQVIESYEGKGELKVYADIAVLDVLQQPGTHENVPNIPLVTPVKDDNVSLSQTTVKGSIEVKAADAHDTLNSLPVWVGGAPPVMRDYEVQLTQPVITNVTVTGPADKIQELMKPDSPMRAEARAWLIVTREDTRTVGTVQSKKLLYVLPKGVTVSPQDEGRLFEFKLVNKSASGG
jgi:hypothetical protein